MEFLPELFRSIFKLLAAKDVITLQEYNYVADMFEPNVKIEETVKRVNELVDYTLGRG